jgi:glutamate racemase
LELQKFAPEIVVNQLACPLWVPLIENNKHFSEAGKNILSEDVNSLLAKDPKIDTIILGCTHYPLVQEYLESIVSKEIKLVSQGEIVAKKLEQYLLNHPEITVKCSKNSIVQYLTTEDSKVFDENAARFLRVDIHSETIHF